MKNKCKLLSCKQATVTSRGGGVAAPYNTLTFEKVWLGIFFN